MPFDSWECLGFNADSFSAPEDFEVFLNDGAVDVVFEAGDVTATGIVARDVPTDPQSQLVASEGKADDLLESRSVPDVVGF